MKKTKFFIINTLCFILIVPVGTLLHELGHFIAADILNLSPILHFDCITYQWLATDKISNLNEFWVILMGPFSNMSIAFIGLIGLIKIKKKYTKYFWLYIYLSLFSSREVINILLSSIYYCFCGTNSIFGGDEFYLNTYLNLPNGLIPIIFALIGSIICFYVIFFQIPKKKRNVFLISGFLGGMFGFYTWFKIIGTYVLP